MTGQDVERIARAALRELGAPEDALTVREWEGQPGCWRISIDGSSQGVLKVRCGAGSSPQWVREQIIEQFLTR